jgi:mannose-1-phosphate guanylyltransferase
MADNLWSVILAAGSGRRLAPVTQGVPKQFWCPGGRGSLLDETLARVAPLAPPSRTTVVVDRTHRPYVDAAPQPWPADWLIYQPGDRGTAAGILLALSPVLWSSPDEIVLLTPSDHGINDIAMFRSSVAAALTVVRSRPMQAVLFGVEPEAPVADYGWIVPGERYRWAQNPSLRPVAGFIEKPAAEVAGRLFTSGAVWNTMVLVARAGSLLELYRRHLPGLASTLETYRRLPRHRQETYLADQYSLLPNVDFSRDVLAPATGLALYTWERSIGWSDLGTPDRLRRWLASQTARSLKGDPRGRRPLCSERGRGRRCHAADKAELVAADVAVPAQSEN